MSGLVSRVLQRATHPGGGLEPLRISRAALRTSAASSLKFPAEEMREVVAPEPWGTARIAKRMEASITPVISSPAAVVDRTLIHGQEEVDLQARMGPTRTTETTHASFRKAIAEQEITNNAIETGSELQISAGEGKSKEFLTERVEEMMQERSSPQTPEFQMFAATPARGIEIPEVVHPVDVLMPPVLEISIGHIEVQAGVRAPERPRTPPFRPRVSLHDFLARSGRR